MTVFVETVLFENFVVDMFLLWLTLKTLKQSCSWKNLFISSTFGAVFALLSANLSVYGFFAIVLKLFVAFFMCLSLDFSFKLIFQKTLLFLLYTFCFGGLLIAVFWFLNMPIYSQTKSAVDVSNVPVGAILVLILAFFMICFGLLKKFFRRQKIDKFCYDLKLSMFGKEMNLKGFLDTGNTIFDSKKRPVLILSKKNFVSFGENVKKYLNCPVEKIDVKSVSGSKQILIFVPDKCEFNGKNHTVSVGICEDDIFSKNDFDIILNPKMLEV